MVAKLVLCCSWKRKLFELAGYCISVSIISMTDAFRVPVVNFELVICLLLPSVLACFCVLLDCEWKMICLHACHDPTLIPAVLDLKMWTMCQSSISLHNQWSLLRFYPCSYFDVHGLLCGSFSLSKL